LPKLALAIERISSVEIVVPVVVIDIPIWLAIVVGGCRTKARAASPAPWRGESRQGGRNRVVRRHCQQHHCPQQRYDGGPEPRDCRSDDDLQWRLTTHAVTLALYGFRRAQARQKLALARAKRSRKCSSATVTLDCST
jgi:hypothetical protein